MIGRISERCNRIQIGCALAVVLLAGSCAKTVDLPPGSARPTCPPATATDFFFQSGTFLPRIPEIDARIVASGSRILRAAGEESLSCGDIGLDRRVFRFYWDRQFQGGPLVIRASNLAAGPHIFAVELDQLGEKIVWKSDRALSSAEWEKIREDVRYADVAGMETYQMGSKDGSNWSFELRSEGFYKVVRRWSPVHTAFKDLCLGLIHLSGANVPEEHLR
jgi:hypothetical protein